jgi:gamma-glutamylcyclotransferase (GGCT)/AIG2-like uncharacterized protein YtfP
MSTYLFAYGTLRPGREPGEIAPMTAKLRAVGAGFVRGSLYDLGEYPGAVLDDSADNEIAGTVLELPVDAGVLEQLDAYEGYDPAVPATSLFVRVLHRVTLVSGGELTCWIYVYNGDLTGTRRVGGWLCA